MTSSSSFSSSSVSTITLVVIRYSGDVVCMTSMAAWSRVSLSGVLMSLRSRKSAMTLPARYLAKICVMGIFIWAATRARNCALFSAVHALKSVSMVTLTRTTATRRSGATVVRGSTVVSGTPATVVPGAAVVSGGVTGVTGDGVGGALVSGGGDTVTGTGDSGVDGTRTGDEGVVVKGATGTGVTGMGATGIGVTAMGVIGTCVGSAGVTGAGVVCLGVGGAGVGGAGVVNENEYALFHAPHAFVVTPFLIMEG